MSDRKELEAYIEELEKYAAKLPKDSAELTEAFITLLQSAKAFATCLMEIEGCIVRLAKTTAAKIAEA